MTVSTHDRAATSDAQETKKQRKKQAKREAKLLLELGQARDEVQRAEQKVAKAQARLEASRTHLRDLEAKVQGMHTPQEEAQPENAMNNQTSASFTAESSTDGSTPANQVTSVPPAEGRTDIPGDVPQETSSPSAEADPTSESSTPSPD